MKRYINALRHFAPAVMLMLTASQLLAQQTMSLSEAIALGVNNFQTIKSKELQIQAANKELQASKTLYMPEITLSAQQFYGTANALQGPLYSFGEGNISMGLPQAQQNWDAAFSSLYLANFNWNIFSFGATRHNVKLSKERLALTQADLAQAVFQHQIKIASAYLNLLAINEIIKVQEENIVRASVLVEMVKSLTTSKLRPQVELFTAESELAGTKIALFKAQDQKASLLKELVVLIGVPYQNYILDQSLTERIPERQLLQPELYVNHPLLRSKELSVAVSYRQSKVLSAQALPTLRLVGSVAARGSGFQYNYATNPANISRSYLDGVGIDRGNYLVGLNLSWNITSFAKKRFKTDAQRAITLSLEEEKLLVHQELSATLAQAAERILFARNQYEEVQKQTYAATQSYQQYESLYRNGLTVIDDLVQAMYNLTRAESNKAVIQINVWQAYLLQAASSGDLETFLTQIQN